MFGSVSAPWHKSAAGLPIANFTSKAASTRRYWRYLIAAFSVIVLTSWVVSLTSPTPEGVHISKPSISFPKWGKSKPTTYKYQAANGKIIKPNGMKLVALVFYGRRSRVEILDCYLQQNLVRNGGLFDEVQFVVQTADIDDLEWLFNVISRTPGYKKVLPNEKFNPDEKTFGGGYDHLEHNTMYLKIDDDVIYIGENTVAEMLRIKLGHPEYFMISSNTINNPRTSYIHQHIDAVQAFLPELETPTHPSPNNSWRTSELPIWSGPDDYKWEPDQAAPSDSPRWLPLLPVASNWSQTDFKRSLDRTPIMQTDYGAFGAGWNQWAIAAQQHYSLLANLEKDPSLPMYELRDIWDMGYDRISINFIMFYGNDVLDNGPMPNDDEMYLSSELPQKLGRHSAIAGKAPLAHYSFFIQTEGLDKTDILRRYKAYAQERVCQKKI